MQSFRMNWFNQRAIAAIGVAVVAVLGVYLIQQRRLSLADLERQNALAAVEQSSSDNPPDTHALKATEQQINSLRQKTRQLPRLCNELTQLRRERAERGTESGHEIARTDDPTTRPPLPPGKYISKQQLAFAGYETPEASAQSGTWALVSGNYEVRTNILGSNFTMDRQQFEGQRRNMQWGLKGIQILARKSISDDAVELKVREDLLADSSILIWRLLRVGNEWKDAGSMGTYTAEWDKTGIVESFTP